LGNVTQRNNDHQLNVKKDIGTTGMIQICAKAKIVSMAFYVNLYRGSRRCIHNLELMDFRNHFAA